MRISFALLFVDTKMRLIQVVVFLMIFGQERALSPAAVAEGLASVFSFGLDIYGLIESTQDDGSHKDDSKDEEMKKAFSDKIDESLKHIYDHFNLQKHFDRLYDIRKFIGASLIYIKNIIHSNTKEEKDENIRRFKEDYTQHKADRQQIAFLLTDETTIIGPSMSFKDAFVKNVECNLTSLEEFKYYYMHLVSAAFGIDLINEYFNDVDLSNQTKDFWMDIVEKLYTELESQKNECIDRFPELVRDELRGNENVTDLQRNLALKYLDKRITVMLLYGDYFFKCLEHDTCEYIVFNTTARKLAFFEDKQHVYENIVIVKHNTAEVENNYTKSIPTEHDISRLSNKTEKGNCDTGTITKWIEDMCYWRGYTLSFVLIVDDKPQNQIVIDQRSRLTHLKECGKHILIMVVEGEPRNASSFVYKTETNITSSAAKVTLNATLMICLISYIARLY